MKEKYSKFSEISMVKNQNLTVKYNQTLNNVTLKKIMMEAWQLHYSPYCPNYKEPITIQERIYNLPAL